VKIQAAVLYRKGEKFKIEPVTLDEPKAGEVLVKIVASGICLTDIHVQNQEYLFPLPAVLGHEDAGIAEKAGEGVSTVKPGDHVVLGYAYCGKCQPCLTGAPFSTRLHYHGRELSVFFGQSSFGTYAVVNVNNVVKVDRKLDLRMLGPLGCGIQTGSGTILNHFQPEAGSSIAVFGAGAVGLSAVMASKVVKCGIIIATDIHDNRLELAQELGATHVMNPRKVDVVAEIKHITNPWDKIRERAFDDTIPAVPFCKYTMKCKIGARALERIPIVKSAFDFYGEKWGLQNAINEKFSTTVKRTATDKDILPYSIPLRIADMQFFIDGKAIHDTSQGTAERIDNGNVGIQEIYPRGDLPETFNLQIVIRQIDNQRGKWSLMVPVSRQYTDAATKVVLPMKAVTVG